MDQPYVLAKVHKAGANAKGRRIYAGLTSVGNSKTSSREVVTAVDSQGISIYNLRSNQLANSYSLSPSTKFHCAPISVLDRLTSTRQTYAALQTGTENLRIERWLESGTVEETQTSLFDISEEVRALYFVNDRLIVIYVSGSIEVVSSDLSASLERIEARTYTGLGSVTVLAPWVSPSRMEGDSIDVHILTRGDTIVMHKLRLTFLESVTECEILNSQVEMEVSNLGKAQSNSIYAVSSEAGQFLVAGSDAKELLLNVYNKTGSKTHSLRIVVPHDGDIDNSGIRWLNSSQILVSSGSVHSIWDLVYGIQLDSLTTETDTDVIAIVPQKSISPSTSIIAQLVLCNANQISVSRINYSKESNLLNVIEKRSSSSSAPLWIQDVDIQSTWKDSLSTITAPAKRCLSEMANSGDGLVIDSIMAGFLFPGQKIKFIHVAVADQPRQNGTLKINGHAVNGTSDKHSDGQVAISDSEESELAESTIQKTQSSAQETNQRFATYDTDISLSTPFVTKAIHIIFEKLLADETGFVLPSATLDYLLKKGLVSLSGSHDEFIVRSLAKVSEALCLRFISDVPGLLPMQLFTILESAIESPRLKSLLGAIINKLDHFDDNVVILAIRAKIASNHIHTLLSIFSHELEQRNADPEYKNELQVSDHALCSAITTFVDALGVSSLIFNTPGAELLSSLRSSVSQMIAQGDHVGSTAHYISELLMKARIADKIKVVSAEERALESNPEPQPKKSSMPLDKVKKQPKNLSARAKAHAAVQGIGSVYTIETLQI